MAVHGLYDARATTIAVGAYGRGFRRPLVLLRCFVHELATAAQRRIAVAPCCAPGMTRDEGLIVEGLLHGDLAAFEAVCDAEDVGRCLTTAHAVRSALIPYGLRSR